MSIIPVHELAELMNWMLYRFSAADMPAKFEPYTAEEVGRYRQEPLVDVETVRAGLLGDYEETRDCTPAPWDWRTRHGTHRHAVALDAIFGRTVLQ